MEPDLVQSEIISPNPEINYTPDPLRAIFFANDKYLKIDEDLQTIINRVDLVVSLGGIDLEILAPAIPQGKPALAVLGPTDELAPAPFHTLDGNGFSLKRDWRIAGISGAPKLASGVQGLYRSEEELQNHLQDLPAADIFLSHAPATGLEFSNTNPYRSFEILEKYLDARPPIYHFYAHPSESTAEEKEKYISIGVCGKLICDGKTDERPMLEFV